MQEPDLSPSSGFPNTPGSCPHQGVLVPHPDGAVLRTMARVRVRSAGRHASHYRDRDARLGSCVDL